MKHVYLPTKAESANFDHCKMNNITNVERQWKNALSIDRELANAYVYIVL